MASKDASWLLRIKELRGRFGVSIFEAERMALTDPHMRKWAEMQINSDLGCRKYALSHIRRHGDRSLIERIGESFKFRIPDP
jgi:hypothetical protein